MQESQSVRGGRTSEIEIIKSELDASLKRLEEVVSELTTRLANVISDLTPSATTNEKSMDFKYNSKLCQDLHALNNGVEIEISKLITLVDRLEI